MDKSVDGLGIGADELGAARQEIGPRIGLVVPKRWARRAVTRNLLKRQMRQVLAECHHRSAPAAPRVEPFGAGLASGLWVLRLRHGFDLTHFPSAASDALRVAARSELQQLVAQGAQRAVRQQGRMPSRQAVLQSARHVEPVSGSAPGDDRVSAPRGGGKPR